MGADVMLVLVAMVKSFVDLARRAMNKEFKPVVTQLLSYVAGVLVVLVFSKTAYASVLVFAGVSLASAGLATIVVIGIALAATANLAVDALDAVKNKTKEEKSKEPTVGE